MTTESPGIKWGPNIFILHVPAGTCITQMFHDSHIASEGRNQKWIQPSAFLMSTLALAAQSTLTKSELLASHAKCKGDLPALSALFKFASFVHKRLTIFTWPREDATNNGVMPSSSASKSNACWLDNRRICLISPSRAAC